MEVGLLKDETELQNSLQDTMNTDPNFSRARLRKTQRIDVKTAGEKGRTQRGNGEKEQK